MWSNWIKQNWETDKEHDEDCVIEMVRETGNLLECVIAVSVSETCQNWNQLDPGKTVHILKTTFQYFYYLVI